MILPLQIIPLDADSCRDRDRVGGKAAALSCLRATMGDMVPMGVVLPSPDSAVFAEAAGSTALEDKIRRELARSGIRGPWAVRSSAIEEDSAALSFAGQFETLLGIPTTERLIPAIQRCVASAFAPKVGAYRKQAAVTATRAPAVLIQTMIAADRSGVAFSRHPLSGDDAVVINAAFGVGDLIVSGQITPDEFVVSPAGVSAAIGRKQRMTVLVNGSPKTLPVPESMRATASLASHQIEQVADVTRRCERVLGYPVDVEWLLSRGRLLVLQARPITAAPLAESI